MSACRPRQRRSRRSKVILLTVHEHAQAEQCQETPFLRLTQCWRGNRWCAQRPFLILVLILKHVLLPALEARVCALSRCRRVYRQGTLASRSYRCRSVVGRWIIVVAIFLGPRSVKIGRGRFHATLSKLRGIMDKVCSRCSSRSAAIMAQAHISTRASTCPGVQDEPS